LTFENYLRLLVSFGLITCRVVWIIHLWRPHEGGRPEGDQAQVDACGRGRSQVHLDVHTEN